MSTNAETVSQSIRAKSKSRRRNTAASGSKVDHARDIFNKMEGAPRREVVEAFVKTAGLTPSGASTYYQKFLGELKSSGKTVPSRPRGRPTDESSKAGMARALFKKLAGKPRKDIIQQFVDKLKLTPSGAATYYQTLKKSSD